MAEPLVTGVEGVLERLNDMATVEPKLFNVGVQNAAEMVFDRSQELVPVDTGRLKASGRIIDGEKREGYEEYRIQYGGDYVGTPLDVMPIRTDVRGGGVPRGGAGPAEYAWIVHEDLTKGHAPPTQAKYLEQAVNETVDLRMRVIKDVMRFRGTVRGLGGPA